jgi:predicted transcriptional regulator
MEKVPKTYVYTNVLAKFRFNLFYKQFLKFWYAIRTTADTTTIRDTVLQQRVQKLIKIDKLSDKDFASLLGLTASALSKDYLYNDWVFPYQNEITSSRQGFATFLESLDDAERTTGKKGQALTNKKASYYVEMITALSDTKYNQACETISAIFEGYFSWDEFFFTWTFNPQVPQKAWPLEDVLNPILPDSISGKSGYLYKHVSDGIHRMTLHINSFKNEKGFYAAELVEKLEMQDADHLESSKYEGTVFSDVRPNDHKIIFLLKHVQSKTYAHLILFANKGDRPDSQSLFVGHFTYYTLTQGVNKYLTKLVILDLATGYNPNDLLPRRILKKGGKITEDEKLVSEREKYIRRYLASRYRSRLTSIRSSILSLDDFKDWMKARSPHRDLLGSYANKSYYVFYIKRIPSEEGSVPFKFYQDRLTLTADLLPEYLEATYHHYRYDEDSHQRTASREREHKDNYQGRFFLSNNFLYGLLLTQKHKDPLYLIMHIDPKGYNKEHECFLGSVAAARDETRSLAVTYSCVLVPTTTLGTGIVADTYRQIIESYLKNEAITGWGTVDPPLVLTSKYSIEGLKRRRSTKSKKQKTDTP